MAERHNLTSSSWPEQERGEDAGYERTAEEIRQDIAARRESITEAVDMLSDRFQRRLDWRAYVYDYPLAAVGVAAGLGFLAARIFKPRLSAGDRIKDALAYGVEDLTARFRHQLDGVNARNTGFGLGRTVRAAATGLITKVVTDYLRDKFAPGYEQYPEEIQRRAMGQNDEQYRVN
jgi:hypothetical protein